VGPEELSFPVLCLSRDTSIIVARDADSLSRCNALAFWVNGYFRELLVIDLTGASFTVVEAETEPGYSPVARFLARLTNRELRVRLRLRCDGTPSLAAAQRLVGEWLDKAPEFWEASAELSEWKARVMACDSMAQLIEVFE